MKFIYKHSIIGGTFDHFHIGHQKLIDTAFEQSEHIAIGLTKPAIYQNKFLSQVIESYSIREKTLKKYLKERNFLDQASIIPISDIYGTTLLNKNIEAIFATEENLPNIKLINSKRKKIGFRELKVITVPYVNDNSGQKITSQRIRKGEIDREGFVYTNIFEKKSVLTLPDNLRPTLQKPIGKVVKDTQSVIDLLNKDTIIIAVGDIIVSKLREIGFNPAISIIDFKTRRQPFILQSLGVKLYHPWGVMSRHLRKNLPGTISKEAVFELGRAIGRYLNTNKPQTVAIDGEEDLLALPAILLAPLDSIVLYGQFDMGIVVNRVTEELKNNVKKILEKFR